MGSISIDVIIATYNRAALLERAVQTLLSSHQAMISEDRITIVDNNSSDATREVSARLVQQSGGRVRYLFEPRQGKSYAVNTGLAQSTAEVLAFADDDQRMGEEWIDAIRRAIADGYDYVTGPVYPDLDVSAPKTPEWYDDRLDGVISLFDGGDRRIEHSSDESQDGFLGGNSAVRRTVIEKVGGYHNELGKLAGTLAMGEDCEFFIRLKRAGCRGLYEPRMQVFHLVPPERLTKSYFRRWYRSHGSSMALVDRLHPKPVRYWFGVPRFLIRRTLEAVPRMAAAQLRGDLPGAFEQELQLWFMLGFLQGKDELRVASCETSSGKDLSQPATCNPQPATLRMSREPAVSIIISAFNVAPYIGETLSSVFAQTFTDYEAIVVNDGSSDETEQAIEPFGRRIVYLKQENRGVSAARNTGIRAARGRYLTLLDGDDILLPDYLAKLVGMLEADRRLDLVFPNAILFGAPRWEGRLFQDLYPPGQPITFARLLNRDCHIFISAMFRRALVDEVGMFDESLRASEDFDLWLRLAQSGCRFGFTTAPLARYRKRPDSLTHDGLAMFRSLTVVYEKVRASLPVGAGEHSLIEEKLIELRAQENFALSKQLLAAKDYAGARRHLALANDHFHSVKLGAIRAALRVAPALIRRLALRA